MYHCHANGRMFFTDDGEPNTPALRGSWSQVVPEEPLHLAEVMQPLWDDQREQRSVSRQEALMRRRLLPRNTCHAQLPGPEEGSHPEPASFMHFLHKPSSVCLSTEP